MRWSALVVAAALLAACGRAETPVAPPTTTTTVSAPTTVASTTTTTVPTTTVPTTTVLPGTTSITTAQTTLPSTTPPPTTPPPTTTTPTTRPPTTAAPTTAPPTTPPPPTTAPTAPPAVVVRVGTTTQRVVTLTFDAGSDPGSAGVILDILAAEGIRATFFVTGRFTEQNPALVARMAAEGHRVGNHSYSHPSFTGASTGTAPLTAAEIIDQLRRADAAISARTGRTTKPLFRPPYGDQNAFVNAVLGAEGYRYDVLWTVDTLGWKGVDPSVVVQRCLDGATPGAILMFHVGSASTDAAALPQVIDALRAAGWGFVPLEAVLP